jgi:competence protein ComEC
VFDCRWGHNGRVAYVDIPLLREIKWPARTLERVLGAPLRLSEPSPARLILWAPVALGAGAAAYFLPIVEPAAWIGQLLAGLGVALVAIGLVGRAHASLLYAATLTALLAFGFALAQARTLQAAPPVMEISNRAVTIDGWIEAVERGGTRPRLRIRVASMSGADIPPHRIRVRAGLDAFGPGDAVSFSAVLTPPPRPAAPGGYDPARAAWFDRVAFTGFTVSALSHSEIEMGDRIERGLARLRWMLAERIRETVGPDTGGVAAALLTGDRSGVEQDDAEALRISGLGHILAISGLHMALFAGGIYFFARLVLAAIDPFARAQDPRKAAAVIALIAATGYLILSGAAIPTQRAWVMAAVVLIGVILDRRAFSMRSLSIAALVVIVLAPESVVEAGFQMSFSAVAALIAVYEIWNKIRPRPEGPRGLVGKSMDAFGGLAMTSVVAGAATGAFAAFHFQRIAAYGLIANLSAMPVFTFWVMPAGVVALGLSPFGLDGPALSVMDAGLRVVLAIAHWTEDLSGSGVPVLAADGIVIGLYAAGFAAATLGLGLVRIGGVGVSLVALGLWALQSPADLMVTDDGVIIAQFESEGVYQASSLRASRFETRVLLQRAGQGGAGLLRAPMRCDAYGCIGVTQDGVRVAITDVAESLAEDCRQADLVVFAGMASAWRKRRCGAVLLDETALQDLGGMEFRIEAGQLSLMGSAQAPRRQRIWSRADTPG